MGAESKAARQQSAGFGEFLICAPWTSVPDTASHASIRLRQASVEDDPATKEEVKRLLRDGAA